MTDQPSDSDRRKAVQDVLAGHVTSESITDLFEWDMTVTQAQAWRTLVTSGLLNSDRWETVIMSFPVDRADHIQACLSRVNHLYPAGSTERALGIEFIHAASVWKVPHQEVLVWIDGGVLTWWAKQGARAQNLFPDPTDPAQPWASDTPGTDDFYDPFVDALFGMVQSAVQQREFLDADMWSRFAVLAALA